MWKIKALEKETEPECWHCGTKIVWVCWIENTETGEIIAVGQDCCCNFLSYGQTKKVKGEIKQISKELKTKAACDEILETTKETSPEKLANWLAVKGGGYNFVEKYYPGIYRRLA